jgi:hypothetical protein
LEELLITARMAAATSLGDEVTGNVTTTPLGSSKRTALAASESADSSTGTNLDERGAEELFACSRFRQA